MTRLMYWNVRDFGQNKINNPGKKRKRGSSLSDNLASQDRRWLITANIANVNPDIFVLVETEAPASTNRGQLVQNRGSLTLLGYLQNDDASWRLVPPLKTGPQECVSIYYKQTDLIFSGPYVWPGGANGTAQPNGLTGNYPAAYRNGLGNRGIPNGAPNQGTNERLAAARVEFTYHANHTTQAGNPYNFGNQRAPYMATFAELDNNNPRGLLRNITVFGIHAPASNNARNYLRNLPLLAQVRDNLGANEVRVIAGDFNWNLLDNNLQQRASYNQLVNNGNYALALTALPNPPNPEHGYATYFGTHLKTANIARWWSTNAQTVYYPGYGYYSASDFAIDNIYTRHGNNTNPPNNNRFTIINNVVGSPYTANNPPDPNTPVGNLATPIQLMNAAYNNPPNPGVQYQNGMATNFRGWDNYGYIYSTSDHQALAIDI